MHCSIGDFKSSTVLHLTRTCETFLVRRRDCALHVHSLSRRPTPLELMPQRARPLNLNSDSNHLKKKRDKT